MERQTLQSQAITGTPCDVPVPKKVNFMKFFSGKDTSFARTSHTFCHDKPLM
jgi:hypothetical protein